MVNPDREVSKSKLKYPKKKPFDPAIKKNKDLVKKKTNGKKKGGQFERDIAKRFTLWASGQMEEYWFWRSPGSGGVATVSVQNVELTGDIIAVKPEGKFLTDKFSIELKVGYPKINLQHHIAKIKTDILRDFWTQCNEDATKAKKMPLLIFQKSLHRAAIGVPRLHNLALDLPYIMFSYSRETGLPPIYIFDLEDFLNTFSPRDIVKI